MSAINHSMQGVHTPQVLSVPTTSELKRLLDAGFNSIGDLLDRLLGADVTFMNPLLGVDVYKMGHMEQYKPGTTEVYDVLVARSDKMYDRTVFFGLQWWLKTYLTRRLTPAMAEEFLENRKAILGSNSPEVERKIRALGELGYFPVEIKAVPEGTVMTVQNVLMTVRNTHPDFHWVPGFLESLIMKVWDAIASASCVFVYRQIVEEYYEKTVTEEQMFLKEFACHDFGYRGCGSEQEAAITGAAFLMCFSGSDTVIAREFLIRNYGADRNQPFILSVPASEHSIHCSFSGDDLAYIDNMLRLYPAGIVSIVSDTRDVYDFIARIAPMRKDEILSRDGKVVFRPDSGDPWKIICGDPDAPEGSLEWKGVLRILADEFGYTVNKKGYKVLHAKIGLIYGDGMYIARYRRVLQTMMEMGFAASNLVIGIGGIVRNHSRDSQGISLKATHVINNGVRVDIQKDPVTDPGKKSPKGLVSLSRDEAGVYHTKNECTLEEEAASLLEVAFRDGAVPKDQTHMEVRTRLLSYIIPAANDPAMEAAA